MARSYVTIDLGERWYIERLSDVGVWERCSQSFDDIETAVKAAKRGLIGIRNEYRWRFHESDSDESIPFAALCV
ncbi:MAG: hypothetical protein MN733_35120 [Nitrososphaera sp.]|nr:hypothetical protein [Nitrososphaera sp.]